MTIKNSIDQATAIIRESGAVELVRAWMSEDGHAPASSEWLRTVLVGWVATALAGRPLTEQHVAKTVKKMPGSTVTTEQVARVTRRVLEVIDYSPLPASDGPLTKNEYEAVLAGRRLNATSLELKRLRFLEFTNALLLAQRDLVPELVGRKYDVALGSVFRAAGVAGLGHASYERLAGSDCVSLEPDAGFVHLHSDPDNFGYGWRSEVATLVPDTMEAPAIAVGIVHSPRNLRHSFHEMAEALDASYGPQRRRHNLNHIVADTAYRVLAHSALGELGAKLVMPYHLTDEGQVMAVADGAFKVEGRWYRDDLPATLRDAMKTYHEVTAANRVGTRVADWDVEWGAEECRDAAVKARRTFETTPRDAEDASTHAQELAYGSTAWQRLTAHGEHSSAEFAKTFDRSQPTPRTTLTGAAAHGFLTTCLLYTSPSPRDS